MAKKINIIEEIRELIQQIKKEYQEGVDFKFSSGKNALKNHGVAFIVIISPRLKKFFRERFNFPLGVVNHLDYLKMGQEGSDLLYRINNYYDNDSLSSADGRVWPEKEKGENCQVCGSLVFKKNGRMQLWDGEKTGDRPDPKVIGYFHPECAKKYFADKNQPNQNDNARIKEKLLRNLDRLCLDPVGYLANNEYLKTDGAEEEYQKEFNSAHHGEWKNRYLKIVIDGKEIDLEDWDNTCPEYWEVKRELIKKIKSEIKQNPSEWKIEKGTDKNNYNGWLVKNQKTGQRYWRLGLDHLNRGKQEKHWAEIETLINGSELPNKNNKPTNSELQNIKKIFREHNIRKITFENNKLTIEYNDKQKEVKNQEFKELEKYCREHNEHVIDSQKLGIGSNSNNDTNSEPNKGNHKLVIGLMAGVGATILVGIMIYFVRKRKNK